MKLKRVAVPCASGAFLRLLPFPLRRDRSKLRQVIAGQSLTSVLQWWGKRKKSPMAVTSRKIAPGAKPKVTRAKKVAEVPAEVEYVSPFAVGNRVTHTSFGNGEVEEVSKNQLSIRFDNVGAKVILDSFVAPQKS
jgi:hypothetical protein